MWDAMISDKLVSIAPQLGAPESFYLTLALVLARIAVLVILSSFLGLLGVVAMDFLTPLHGLRQRIGQSAVATAWFAQLAGVRRPTCPKYLDERSWVNGHFSRRSQTAS